MAAAHLPVPAVPRPNAQTQTSLALNLCVDGSTTYPCPTPITTDGTYIPAIELTYGQILDGVIIYGPPSLTDGTITSSAMTQPSALSASESISHAPQTAPSLMLATTP